jgi:hypothetical protein
MPYPNAIQHRVGLTDKKNRFRWQVGSEASAKELYGVEWLRDIDNTLLVVEGTTDVAAALLLRVPVVGLPGTGTWSRKTGPTWAKELEGHDIVLWQEPGEAGQKLVDSVAQDIPDLRVIQAPPGIKDICELLEQAGDGAGEMLRELMIEAPRYYPENVANIAIGNSSLVYSHIGDTPSDRSQLWKAAEDYFPKTGIRPYLRGAMLHNSKTGKENWVNYYGRTWRNPENAQQSRRCLFYNLLPKVNGPQLFGKWIPVDDWTDKMHHALARQIQRAIHKAGGDHGWLWVNNALERGYYVYWTSVPNLPGFEPVADVEGELVDALRAIHPPNREEPGRFRPYGGSDNWVKRAETTGQEDQDVCELLAVAPGPTDFVQIEAECRVAGVREKSIHRYWRAQFDDGLETNFGVREALAVAMSLGYRLTKQGRAYLLDGSNAGWEDDNRGRVEYVKTKELNDQVQSAERWVLLI